MPRFEWRCRELHSHFESLMTTWVWRRSLQPFMSKHSSRQRLLNDSAQAFFRG